MTDVLVAIPWAGSCPHRIAARDWVIGRWRTVGHEPRLGVVGGPWVKADAVNAAVDGSTAEILVVADADVWTDGIHDAIDHVAHGAPWAVPHGKLHRLSPASTRAVLGGQEPYEGIHLAEDEPLGKVQRPYLGRAGGGIVVLRRDVYDDCPLDPRFVGWGHEDEGWALALRCLHGPAVRFDHPMWHLWHPPQPRLNRGLGSPESERLYRRYARAHRNPSLMRALIEEHRLTIRT